ncbi:MAG: sodium:solute symporter family protein [Sulfolobales archaeon]|nr:sodium:solute symporter family protein [Sulfolobales archaeon]MDW7969266.1 sodium:solute symporter family protein [Sulfolobales archaeon]
MLAHFAVFLAAYIVLGTLIAVISRRFGVKSTREYFVGNYRLGGFLSSMTYAATTYSAFMMVGLVGLTYATGVGALGFELIYLLATLALLAIFSKKVWLMAREHGWVSPSEMLSGLYGSKLLGKLTALTYLISLIPYISAQVIGIGTIFESLGLNYFVGVSVAAFLILLWTILAGIWSVATTDAYQAILMIVASVVFLVTTSIKMSSLNVSDVVVALDKVGVTGITPFWSFSTFLAYTLPWIFFAVTNPQVVQRMFMPVNEKALKNTIKYFSLYGYAYTLIVVTVGLMARALTEFKLLPVITNRDLVTPTLALTFDPSLTSLIFVSIIAAAVSTANSIILSIASSIIRDFYEVGARKVSAGRILLYSNLVVVCLTVISMLVAYLRPGFVVEMSVLSSVILLPLAPITITGWLSPTRAKKLIPGAVAGLVGGAAFALYNALIYGPVRTFLAVSYGLPISFWVLAIATASILVNYLFINLKSKEVRNVIT